MRAYRKFLEHGIYTPMDVSRWAKERGLLDVHIAFVKSKFRINAWEVRSPSMYTANLSGFQRFNALSGKDQAEQTAKDWASAKYGVDSWCRIEGMGNTLFPLAVAELVKEQVGVSYRKRRQHSKG